MLGGTISQNIYASDSSTINVSGGSINSTFYAYDSSTVNLSGGLIETGLSAHTSSVVTFNVRDFRLGSGLTLDGERLLGTGILSGEWVDTTRWTMEISTNSGAGIFISLVGPGDANGDGVVDEKDVDLLEANWLTATGATWRMGDFNGDYAVNDIDATILATNWGAGNASVPEPGTITLLLCGLASLALLRRRL